MYWLSSYGLENSAYVARTTGRIYWYGPEGPVDPDAPDDPEDGAEYVAVPDKNDLNLGRQLVRAFVSEHAPHIEQEVHQLFRRRGAYARYKALLQRQDLLDRWHEYERSATRRALERWATEQGFTVGPPSNA